MPPTRVPPGPTLPDATIDHGFVSGVTARGRHALEQIDRFQQSHRRLALLVAAVKKFGDDQGGNLAAVVSYYLFFSIFPLLMVFVTVFGFVLASRPDLQGQLLDSALTNFPIVGDQIRANVGTATGNWMALIIGLSAALWGGTGAIGAMQNTMNTIWAVPIRERPGLVGARVRSLLMLVLLSTAIAMTTVLGGVVGAAATVPGVGRLIAVVPALLLNIGLFWASFKVLTEHAPPWRALLPGAVAAGIVFTVLQTAGAAYVDLVVRGAGQVYGTFAVVLGLLSWLYLQAQLTVVCAEVNVVLERGLYPRSLLGDGTHVTNLPSPPDRSGNVDRAR